MHKKSCRVPECSRSFFGKGLCRLHYHRKWRTGSTDDPPSAEERAWARVRKTATCWFWVGSIANNGYGVIRRKGTETRAHRYFYKLLRGEIPKGLVLDHLCRNRACVRPDHLDPVTNVENVMRGINPPAVNARRTHCKEGHPLTQLYGERGCLICKRARDRKNWRIRTDKRKASLEALRRKVEA